MAMKARSLPVLGPAGFSNLAYWEWESAAPQATTLVCVHGLTRNGRDFDVLATALSKQYRVVCPDMPGRGRSEWLGAAQDYNFPVYLSAMAALLARLDVGAVDWVGTSMGGLIGMLLAGLPKSPVRKLVLNDVGPFLPSAALQRIGSYVGADPAFANRNELELYLRRVHATFGGMTEADWRHVVAHGGRTREDGRLGLAYDPRIGDAFRAEPPKDMDLWAYYDAVSCPTLVIRGAQSDLLRPEDAAAMRHRGPKAELYEVADSGHAPSLTTAEQIARITEFLAG